MKATIPYIEQKFDEFNQQMFEGRLPKLPIELSNAKTFLGKCAYKMRVFPDGKKENFNFRLRINTRIDLPEQVVEDTIIHEMIHYYIGVNQLEDSSSHGLLFRHIMNSINEKFGRHLSVSHKGTKVQSEQSIDTRPRWHVIAVVNFKDGGKGIKVLPRIAPKIVKYYNSFKSDKKVKDIELYMHDDPYFNRFPNSSALNCRIIDEEYFRPHLAGAKVMQCDGNTVK